jgi:hypothetical protein
MPTREQCLNKVTNEKNKTFRSSQLSEIDDDETSKHLTKNIQRCESTRLEGYRLDSV